MTVKGISLRDIFKSQEQSSAQSSTKSGAGNEAAAPVQNSDAVKVTLSGNAGREVQANNESASGDRSKRLNEVRAKVESGFYNSEAGLQATAGAVAEKLLF